MYTSKNCILNLLPLQQIMMKQITMTTKNQLITFLTTGLIILFSFHLNAAQNSRRMTGDTIRLSGKWRFQTDPDNIGVKQAWYKKQLEGSINLPGSMTSNHLGDEITVNTPWTGGIED